MKSKSQFFHASSSLSRFIRSSYLPISHLFIRFKPSACRASLGYPVLKSAIWESEFISEEVPAFLTHPAIDQSVNLCVPLCFPSLRVRIIRQILAASPLNPFLLPSQRGFHPQFEQFLLLLGVKCPEAFPVATKLSFLIPCIVLDFTLVDPIFRFTEEGFSADGAYFVHSCPKATPHSRYLQVSSLGPRSMSV
jgi:hypothetical protein